MPDKVTPIEALEAVKNSTIGAVRTTIIAVVQSYNPITNTAICKFARRSQTADGQIFDPQPTPPLPVRWMKGGGWVLRWELQTGDLVDLEVHDRSIGEVLAVGGTVDPENQRRFSIGDAVVIPGMASDKSPLAAGTADLVLGREDGSGEIRISKVGVVTVHGDVKIELGTGATGFLVNGTTLAAAIVPILVTLALTPPATDPATTQALANANNVAIVAIAGAIQGNLSSKTATV